MDVNTLGENVFKVFSLASKIDLYFVQKKDYIPIFHSGEYLEPRVLHTEKAVEYLYFGP